MGCNIQYLDVDEKIYLSRKRKIKVKSIYKIEDLCIFEYCDMIGIYVKKEYNHHDNRMTVFAAFFNHFTFTSIGFEYVDRAIAFSDVHETNEYESLEELYKQMAMIAKKRYFDVIKIPLDLRQICKELHNTCKIIEKYLKWYVLLEDFNNRKEIFNYGL